MRVNERKGGREMEKLRLKENDTGRHTRNVPRERAGREKGEGRERKGEEGEG